MYKINRKHRYEVWLLHWLSIWKNRFQLQSIPYSTGSKLSANPLGHAKCFSGFKRKNMWSSVSFYNNLCYNWLIFIKLNRNIIPKVTHPMQYFFKISFFSVKSMAAAWSTISTTIKIIIWMILVEVRIKGIWGVIVCEPQLCNNCLPKLSIRWILSVLKHTHGTTTQDHRSKKDTEQGNLPPVYTRDQKKIKAENFP